MISKTTYVSFKNCPLSLYLSKHKPSEATEPSGHVIKAGYDGNLVGELAKTYFPNTYDASAKKQDGTLDLQTQVENTRLALQRGEKVIAEASFLYDDLFCAVDLLVREGEGFSIYEVKHNFSVEDKHRIDVAFQKYVLEKCGLNIVHLYVMHVNKEYIYDGVSLDLNSFFLAEEIPFDDPLVSSSLSSMDGDIASIHALLIGPEIQPSFDRKCDKCGFAHYCSSSLPTDWIGNLYRSKETAYEKTGKGIVTIDDLLASDPKFLTKKPNRLRALYIEYLKTGNDKPHIEKDNLRSFLSEIRYPLYHLDFETTSCIIPVLKGFTPGESFPYQYSLHIEYQNGRIEHKEYLASSFDCIDEIAKSLCENIPMGSCLLAHHDATEKSYIKFLAKKCTAHENHLMDLYNNFIDLAKPFKEGYYYQARMGVSFSIKEVLPTLCPSSQNAYANLPTVHNGSDAILAFHKLMDLKRDPSKQAEYEDYRKGMLAYCKQDTQSMVDVLRVLREAAK